MPGNRGISFLHTMPIASCGLLDEMQSPLLLDERKWMAPQVIGLLDDDLPKMGRLESGFPCAWRVVIRRSYGIREEV